jgi:hypothetical protein
MNKVILVFVCIALTSCGMTFPVMKSEWKPYKDTENIAEVQVLLCESETQLSAVEFEQKLQAQYQAKRQNCLNAASASSTTTVNVYGNNVNKSGTDLSGAFSNLNKSTAALSCNTQLTDNIQIGTAVSKHKSAMFNACMTRAGFLEHKVCVERCPE